MWGVVLPLVAECLTDAWGESVTSEEAHEECKRLFLSTPVIDRKTGELIATKVNSTAALDRKRFGEYLDKIIRWLGETFHCEVPEADAFRRIHEDQ
jgi:hypothetical protein